jgi:Leucine-rich repeat (LRR) protein
MLRFFDKPRWISILVAMAIAAIACLKVGADSIDDELSSYAAAHDAKWLVEIHSLQGGGAATVLDVGTLSQQARNRIEVLNVPDTNLGRIPDLRSLSSLQSVVLLNNQLVDISSIAGLRIRQLNLSYNQRLRDVRAISKCTELEEIDLVGTGIDELPNMSRLTRLEFLGLIQTPLRSLKNIETIPGDFDLSIMDCSKLSDIDSLRFSKVNTLFIDREETYYRFRTWFEAHEKALKASRPMFVIRFELGE